MAIPACRYLRQEAQWRTEIKRSEFIAYSFYCEREEEARTHLKMLWEEHPRARHICYAWRLYDAQQRSWNERSSDDGEPHGTAGQVILKRLSQREAANLLVAVVRYFGGILQGTGGLSRAYAEAAEGVLDASDLALMVEQEVYCLRMGYADYERVQAYCQRQGLELSSLNYGAAVSAELCLPAERLGLIQDLQELLGGRLDVQTAGSRLAPY